jgi:predicted transcriptional regulator
MVTAGMAGKWANIPYSTSHRYFRDLTKLGLVKRHEYTCKGQKQFHYTLSAEGLALVNSGKELPL